MVSASSGGASYFKKETTLDPKQKTLSQFDAVKKKKKPESDDKPSVSAKRLKVCTFIL